MPVRPEHRQVKGTPPGPTAIVGCVEKGARASLQAGARGHQREIRMREIEWLGGDRRRQIIEDFRKPQSRPHMLIGGEAALAGSSAVEVFELPVRSPPSRLRACMFRKGRFLSRAWPRSTVL